MEVYIISSNIRFIQKMYKLLSIAFYQKYQNHYIKNF